MSKPTFSGESGATFDPSRLDGELPPAPAGFRYEILREVARGGLGVIFEAHDRVLGRTVAIKQLLVAGSGERRFRREAQLTAALQHPSIIAIFDGGLTPEGQPFFAMPLVEGVSLDQAIAPTRGLDQRLALLPHVIDVCEAMAYAHERKIIHRDLKPQNILVGRFGESFVIDWGLAKSLAEEEQPLDAGETRSGSGSEWGVTRVGAVIGTPAYMPPEQAAGREVDARADVYALGAVLYQTLAGVSPYVESTGADTLEQLASSPPTPLDRLVPGVPRELLAIVTKAMARRPRDRYPDAAALAVELRRFQTGQFVEAHHYTPAERALRALRRRPLVWGLSVLLALAVAVSAAVNREARTRAEAGERAALEARAAESAARELAQRRADEVTVEHAALSLDTAPHRSLALLAAVSEAYPHAETLRHLAADALSRPLPRQLTTTGGKRLAFSEDGRWLVTGGSEPTVWAVDSGEARAVLPEHEAFGDVRVRDGRILTTDGARVRLWRLPSGEPLGELVGHTEAIQDLELSPDGTRLLTTSLDHTARIWALDTGASTVLDAHEAILLHGAWAPDGQSLVTGAMDGQFLHYGAAGELLGRYPLQGSALYPLFVDEGRGLAGFGNDGVLRRWALRTGRASPYDTGAEYVSALHELADGRLVLGASDGRVHLLDPAGEAETWTAGPSPIAALAVAADGRIAAGAADGSVHVWRAGQALALPGFEAPPTALAFSPDGTRLAGTRVGGEVLVWALDRAEGVPIATSEQALRAVGWLADGRMAAAGDDGRVYVAHPEGAVAGAVWDTGAAVYVLAGAGEGLLVGGEDQLLRLGADGQVRARLATEGLRVWSLFVEEGLALVGTMGGEVLALDPDSLEERWRVALTGRIRRIEPWGEGWVTGTDAGAWAFDAQGHTERLGPDVGLRGVGVTGDSLWSAGPGQPLRRWTAGEVERVEAPLEHVTHADSDGEVALFVDTRGTVLAWTGERLEAGFLHAEYATEARIAPGGRVAASTAWDGRAAIWTLGGDHLRGRRLPPHRRVVYGMEWSPDGRWLGTASDDGTACAWPDTLPHEPAALRAAIAKAAANTGVVDRR